MTTTQPADAPTTDTGPASDRIVDGLRRQILTGARAPGTRILQEDLAREFNASRLPVRDALRRLEGEGLVRLVANTGAWVESLSVHECTEAYLIRERLEPLLLSLSAPHLDDAVVDRLADLATRMQGADLETFLRLDREFHLLSYSGGAAPSIEEIVRRLWNSTQPYRRAYAVLVGVADSPATHAEHTLLVEALRRRDPQDAAHVLELHIRRTRVELARHPDVFDTD
ncbi:GntR family transcriptional regulator [Actinotalea ferrariae CF5-4]|uniref:GntR family transcriptional regulator n=1 Tax=Actinotalea ferrariae CF5-4 TaxID=948458 RepID=A0A021VSC8_9CELL|nr:GntR family transcriptional regulator [Actinotalea ferrariae]EYR64109.1 GntR family transcriptional regulator [Actinotalea ferrariae CF5-4]